MTSETTTIDKIEDATFRKYRTQILRNSDLTISNYIQDFSVDYDRTLSLEPVYIETIKLIRKINDT